MKKKVLTLVILSLVLIGGCSSVTTASGSFAPDQQEIVVVKLKAI